MSQENSEETRSDPPQEEQPTGGVCQGCGTPVSQDQLQFLVDHPRQWLPCLGCREWVQRWVGAWEQRPEVVT